MHRPFALQRKVIRRCGVAIWWEIRISFRILNIEERIENFLTHNDDKIFLYNFLISLLKCATGLKDHVFLFSFLVMPDNLWHSFYQ